MKNDNDLIWIKKIIGGGSVLPTIDDDILRRSDIKRIRKWHKNERDASIEGEICIITVEVSKGIPNVMVRVNESLESLANRLGIDTLAK